MATMKEFLKATKGSTNADAQTICLSGYNKSVEAIRGQEYPMLKGRPLSEMYKMWLTNRSRDNLS